MLRGRSNRRPSANPMELMEIVTPRTNSAVITPAENLFAAISLPEPFGLEIAATHTARWFLARAAGTAMRQHLEAQLAVAYPQAHLRRLDIERYPGLEPARAGPGEQIAACTLVLRGPRYLPIRTFRDPEVDAAHNAQADPVLGIPDERRAFPGAERARHRWPVSPQTLKSAIDRLNSDADGYEGGLHPAAKVATVWQEVVIGAQHPGHLPEALSAMNIDDHILAQLEYDAFARAEALGRSLIVKAASRGWLTDDEAVRLVHEGVDRGMRSVKHQMHVAKFPVHRDLAGFDF